MHESWPRSSSVRGVGLLAFAAVLLAACSPAPATGSGSAGTSGSAGAASAGTAGGTGSVYLLLPATSPSRYVDLDGPLLRTAIESAVPGVSLVVENALGSSQTQARQMQAAISAGAKVVMLVAVDPAAVADELTMAAAAKVPVVLYDRVGRGGPATALVTVDEQAVGRLQGTGARTYLTRGGGRRTVGRALGDQTDPVTTQLKKGQDEVLDPLFDSGQAVRSCVFYVAHDDPATARTSLDQCLTANPSLDAFVVSDDTVAAAAVAAAKAQQRPVTVIGGQGPDLAAVQNIVLGLQYDTVYVSSRLEADKAAELTKSLLTTGTIDKALTPDTVDNGSTAPGVPTAFVPLRELTLDNVSTVVTDGVFTWQQICTGPAGATDTCKAHVPGN